MTDAPHLREEGQQETIGGLLGSLKGFAGWVGEGGWGRIGIVLFGLFATGVIAAILFFTTNPKMTASAAKFLFDKDVEAAIVEERRIAEGQRIDRLMCGAVAQLVLRQGGARGVTRVFGYEQGKLEQIVGVEDVCETNDARGRQLGIKDLPLPIEAIEQTVTFMVKDPHDLKCTALNREDYNDPALRLWLEKAEIVSSVACPIADLSGHPLGLIAVSLRRPIEEAPNLERDVRDVAQKLSGYWGQSLRVQEAIERIKARQ